MRFGASERFMPQLMRFLGRPFVLKRMDRFFNSDEERVYEELQLSKQRRTEPLDLATLEEAEYTFALSYAILAFGRRAPDQRNEFMRQRAAALAAFGVRFIGRSVPELLVDV